MHVGICTRKHHCAFDDVRFVFFFLKFYDFIKTIVRIYIRIYIVYIVNIVNIVLVNIVNIVIQ